jgi:hypothetical protein
MTAPSGRAEEPFHDLTRMVERVLHRRVENVEPVPGGYTAQRVHRLRVAGGRSYVLKAAPPRAVAARLDWPAELEREIDLYRAHPELDPWRPCALGHFEAGGWRALLMEDLGASMFRTRWTESRTVAVAAGLAAMHSAAQARGSGLVHGDVRSDNLFLADDGGLLLVDWAECGPGSGIDDAAYWAVGVELEHGGCAPEVFARYAAVAAGVDAGGVREALSALRRLNQGRLTDPLLPEAVRELRLRELSVIDRWAAVL